MFRHRHDTIIKTSNKMCSVQIYEFQVSKFFIRKLEASLNEQTDSVRAKVFV